MSNASRDANFKPTLLGVSSADGTTPIPIKVNPTTHRVLAEIVGGLTPLTTKGDILTNSGVADVRLPVGTDGQVLTSDSSATYGVDWSNAWSGDALTANPLSQFAATTSLQLAGVISDETGTGALVFANTPTLVTPVLGVATATSINKITITAPATGATLTLSDGSSLITSGGHSITLTSSGATNVTLPTTGTLATTSNKLSDFSATTSAELAGTISDETGSGALVFATSPTLVTPALGTPSSGTLTNCTGLPVNGIVDDTTSALGVGTLELGHISDTTLSRNSAGVLAVEGVVIPSISSTNTLTNKTLTSSTNTLGGVTMGIGSDADGDIYYRSSGVLTRLAKGTAKQRLAMNSGATVPEWVNNIESIVLAVSDETTDITMGTAKITFRMPYAFTLTAVRASLSTASSSGTPTFDINEGGTTILSTKITIDANEKTSTTAVTPAVISDTALADDAEITVDIDVAGTGAKGAKIYLIGYQA